MKKIWGFCFTVLMVVVMLRVVLASVEQTWRAMEPALPFVPPALVVILAATVWYRRSRRW